MYRTICAEFWTDPEIKTLEVSAKFLFLYLITNPHTHLCGLYYLPEETALKETGLKRILYRYGIDTLSKLNKAHWDARTETMFVVNMFEYQGRGSKNYTAAANHIATLHKTPLITTFLERYPQLSGILTDKLRYPIDTVSHISPSVPVSSLSPSESSPNLRSKKHSKKRDNGVAVAIPDEWTPSEKHAKQANALGLDLNIEAAHMRGLAKEKNWKQHDWDQKFSNFLLQEIKFRQARKP